MKTKIKLKQKIFFWSIIILANIGFGFILYYSLSFTMDAYNTYQDLKNRVDYIESSLTHCQQMIVAERQGLSIWTYDGVHNHSPSPEEYEKKLAECHKKIENN